MRYSTEIIKMRNLEKELGHYVFCEFLNILLNITYDQYLKIYNFYDVLFRISGSHLCSKHLRDDGLMIIYDIKKDDEYFAMEPINVIGLVIFDVSLKNPYDYFGSLDRHLIEWHGMDLHINDRYFYKNDLRVNPYVIGFPVDSFSKKTGLFSFSNQYVKRPFNYNPMYWKAGINMYEPECFDRYMSMGFNKGYGLYQFYYQGLIPSEHVMKSINDRIYKMIHHPKVELKQTMFGKRNKYAIKNYKSKKSKKGKFKYRFNDYISIMLAEDYIDNKVYKSQWECYYKAFLGEGERSKDWLYKKQECLSELIDSDKEYLYEAGYFSLNKTLIKDDSFEFSS